MGITRITGTNVLASKIVFVYISIRYDDFSDSESVGGFRKLLSLAPVTIPVVTPASPTPCKDFMNLKEAAAYFGVSVWSIRGLIAKGFIKAKRIGKYDVVRRVDLTEYWQKAA
jgi:excisionase family DNA binding protein